MITSVRRRLVFLNILRKVSVQYRRFQLFYAVDRLAALSASFDTQFYMKIKSVPSYYSSQQTIQYLECIGYSYIPDVHELESNSFHTSLDNLSTIMRLHLTTFPCENTAMHYTESHTMDITPQGLFERMVLQKKGYGSYCFGQNGVLFGILRALGYRVYSGSGRVNVSPNDLSTVLTNIAHMVLFVQLDQGSSTSPTYMVDVGFGNSGLACPIPLVENVLITGAAPPEEHRLVRARHPESSLEALPLITADDAINDSALEWRLEMRCGSHQPNWRALYQFSCAESFPIDYDAQNFAVSQRPGPGPFWNSVFAVKHFFVKDYHILNGEDSPSKFGDTDPMQQELYVGRLVMSGKRVDRRIGDKSETIAVFHTDLERVKALKRYFGIDISEHDMHWITGRVAELYG